MFCLFNRIHFRRSIIASFVLLLILGCENQSMDRAPVIRPVIALKAGGSAPLGGREFTGRARAIREINLAFDVSGTINKLPINVGDSLKKGALLASLDSRDYKSNLKAAKANLVKARSNFKRAQKLLKKDYISRVDYDGLKAAAEVASADVERAQKAVSDSVLKAPFTGSISEIYVENFQAVQPKQQIARLIDTSRIEMVVNIPESLISGAPYVRDIQVRFDALPDLVLSAGIKEIGTEASVTTRTYPVTLVMEQPANKKVLPGMAGIARGKPGKDSPILQNRVGIEVPIAAVFSPTDDGKKYVWVVDGENGVVSRQEVTIGKISSTGMEITSGINAEQWIVIAGVHFLSEGQKVRIQQYNGS